MTEQNNMANNQPNECKCKKKSGLSVVLVIIALAAGVTIGYFGNNILSINSKEEKTEEKSNELKQESSNVVEESNTNVESTSNVTSNTTQQNTPTTKTYTYQDVKGVYQYKGDTYYGYLILLENRVYENEGRVINGGGATTFGNYVIDNGTIKLNQMFQLAEGMAVITRTSNLKINSKNSITGNGEVYTRISAEEEAKKLKSINWKEDLNRYLEALGEGI